jgi:NAD(P)H-flavin reductase
MAALIHAYDVRKESEMIQRIDFNDRAGLKPVAKVFKAEIINVIRLTEMEKLFHLRIVDDNDRERFTFLPGQFVMVEVPGYGEVPISISSSASNKGFIELCIRKAGRVTGVLHRAQRGARVGLRGPFGTHFPLERMFGSNVLLIGFDRNDLVVFCVDLKTA